MSKPRLFGLTASIIVVVSVFGLLPKLGAQLGETAKAPESTKEGRDGLYRPLGLFMEVLSLVRSNYVEPVDVKPLLSGAFSGMTEAMDPFAEYIPADKLAKIGTLIIGSSAADGRDWVRTAWGAAPQRCRPPGEG